MSLKNINSQQSGFTIVELLIVVVVIAILAAITIVSYTGITQQANMSAAKSAASNILKKASAYSARSGGDGTYPATLNALTSAATSSPHYVAPGTVTLKGSGVTSAPTSAEGPSTISLTPCSGNTGIVIGYWDYEVGAQRFLYAGAVGSTSATTRDTTAGVCPTYATS